MYDVRCLLAFFDVPPYLVFRFYLARDVKYLEVKILNLTLQDQAVHPNYQLGP